MDSNDQMSNELLKTYLKQGNISLILDGYEDLFSDFDPRPYSKRTLSDDFIFECKKAVRENKVEFHNLELRLLIPKYKRKTNEEVIIRRGFLSILGNGKTRGIETVTNRWSKMASCRIYIIYIIYIFNSS